MHGHSNIGLYRCWRSLDRGFGTPPSGYDISAAAAAHDLTSNDHSAEKMIHGIAATCAGQRQNRADWDARDRRAGDQLEHIVTERRTFKVFSHFRLQIAI